MSIIFSDFDGTLTDGNALQPVFFDLLDLIKKNHSSLVIVSGRSLSWGHFLLAHFSLASAIMEGGGVITFENEDGFIANKLLVEASEVTRLETITKKLLTKFPEIELSADSFGRKTDRAIELTHLKAKRLKIESFFKQYGVHFSASSIHLNFWCGRVSKALAVQTYLQDFRPGIDPDDCLYFGDALNDQSMFKEFKHTIGVSNIAPYLKEMRHPPATILTGNKNRGPYGVYRYLQGFWK